jgi:glycosyltransferase involved in cell wall biosynthesis
VRNGDIQGLANRILQLIKDDKLRKKMGENAFINSDAFSEDKIMQRWINLFDSLLRLNNEGIGYSTCI